MLEWFISVAQVFEGAPLLQGIAAALCTLILEDPTTVGSGLLVAEGHMAYWSAFWGLTIGIAMGDFGLYLLGRGAQGRVARWGFINDERLEGARVWFDRNVLGTMLAARFLPGMRLPTYVAAGVLRVSALKFVLVAITASLIWTVLLLNLSIHLGGAALEIAGRLKWPLGLGLVLILAIMQWRLARRRRLADSSHEPEVPEEPVQSFFEFWPPILFYIPVTLHYLWLALRFRGLMLPTASNPSIYSGGMIMESKSEILSLVPLEIRDRISPWAVITPPEKTTPLDKVCEQAVAAMDEAGISFPIVAKPDQGQRGFGVRPIHDREQLAIYLADYPAGVKLILQKLVPFSAEAGVFYYRRPDEQEGRIISVTIKHFPAVIGDGRRTLKELIMDNPQTRVRRRIFFKRHCDRLAKVPAEGERVQLVLTGSHAQGAVFKNGTDLATPAMLRCVHEVATAMPEFYFGRFDIRCRSIESLRRGEDYQIVEINGAASEMTHIWDARTRLIDAYGALFQQFRLLFEIGACNRDRGHRPLGAIQLIRDFITYRRQVRQYPLCY